MKSVTRLFLLPLSLALAGCGLFDPKPTHMAYDRLAVVPQEFLYTEYAPLNKWLDTPVRVQMLDVPLLEVFDHPSLRGLNYRITVPPKADQTVLIDKLAMTRRQLLWVLSHDYALMLTPVFGSNGELSWIEVRSKDVPGSVSGSKSNKG